MKPRLAFSLLVVLTLVVLPASASDPAEVACGKISGKLASVSFPECDSLDL